MTGDFWSRRKAAVAAEQEAEKLAKVTALEAEEQEVLAKKPDEEILEELGLPDPETLAPGDDFSAFMSKAVPDRLRRRALRKLWLSNPALANLDGLVDYGEDFTDASTVIENLQTTYQVGKGMAKHVEEMARQAALEEEEKSEPADETDGDEIGEIQADIDSPEILETEPHDASEQMITFREVNESVDQDKSLVENDENEKDFPFRPRRMRYSFKD